jgi:hypothetical protein
MSEKACEHESSFDEYENGNQIQNDLNVDFEQIDPEEERRLVRKLDRVLMPVMVSLRYARCECFGQSPCM